MDGGLLGGLTNALSPMNLLYCFVGCVLGTVVGVLPGLGAAATMAMLLPVTSYLPVAGSIIMLAGILYGAQYGGSITSILMNVPGEAASVATCLDGYEMTKQGRGGEALAIAAIGSFIAGTAGVLLLSIAAPLIANFTLHFGSPEYFGLILFSLTTVVSFCGGQILKGVIVALVGLMLACVGIDAMTSKYRLSFGLLPLLRGFDAVPIMMGLFGVGEVLISAGEGVKSIFQGKIGRLIPRGQELKKGVRASFRGTGIGLLIGVLPGMAPAITTWIAYDIEKRVSKYPQRFGTGVIEGVASPEAANNANVQAGFVPLMALGIPAGPVFAILVAALMMYGLFPGPMLFKEQGNLAWTIIASMYVGNVILLILNLPLVGLWARLCLIPYRYLGPFIFAVCFVGAYSMRNNMFDVWTCFFFGGLGYLMKKTNWPTPPLILGFILGDMLEQNLRATLQMSGGSIGIFFERPFTAAFIGLAVLSVIISRRLFGKIGE